MCVRHWHSIGEATPFLLVKQHLLHDVLSEFASLDDAGGCLVIVLSAVFCFLRETLCRDRRCVACDVMTVHFPLWLRTVLQAKFADPVIFPLDGKPRVVSIPLTESVWKKDPKNTLIQWSAPTQCEMVEVLGGLTSIRILGDHTKWYESVAVDKVAFHVGTTVPLACASIYY